MNPVVFRRVAQQELDDAISWYEKRRIGLGWDYKLKLQSFLMQ